MMINTVINCAFGIFAKPVKTKKDKEREEQKRKANEARAKTIEKLRHLKIP